MLQKTCLYLGGVTKSFPALQTSSFLNTEKYNQLNVEGTTNEMESALEKAMAHFPNALVKMNTHPATFGTQVGVGITSVQCTFKSLAESKLPTETATADSIQNITQFNEKEPLVVARCPKTNITPIIS